MGSLAVQDQSPPTKPSKPQFKSKLTLLSDRFSESKSLDFSTWVSENSSKIFTFSLLALTVATLFFLHSAGDPSALLCFKIHSPKCPQKIEFPEIHYSSIPPVAEVVDYLPYKSYVRKSGWYLFAILHGAKRIFDADDRWRVIGGELGRHFDLDLEGVAAKQQRVLQYSHVGLNRTVVYPYVHFGQSRVYLMACPMSILFFYSKRKSGGEPVDVRFGEHAPKVALPQGMMVPINSFNSVFHCNAFWAMMLPVSVSTMASDVLRGICPRYLAGLLARKDSCSFKTTPFYTTGICCKRTKQIFGSPTSYWKRLMVLKTSASMVKKVVSTMPVHFQVNYKESGPSDRSLTICSSEVFYIPRHFVSDLIDLVDLVGSLEIHHKVEVSMFFMAMDSPQNFDSVLGTMIYEAPARPSNSSHLYSA
ncbi:transmembrane protein, putative [Actinidia rufa]|uniref:Transmembrane protein, putative n=1 Tax=Actinidia rufa TaxID=165716 RepID=A0A7J0F0M0_9ERIC|nr:transmembrane protein, putative [Actinidia rufa]